MELLLILGIAIDIVMIQEALRSWRKRRIRRPGQ